MALSGCGDADCGHGGGLRLRVGGTTYAVPGWADAMPHEYPRSPGLVRTAAGAYAKGLGQFCQRAEMPVIDTLRFDFRLPRHPAMAGGHAAQSITRRDVVTAAYRPEGPPFAAASIMGVASSPLSMDRPKGSATFDLRLRMKDGGARTLPVGCMWADAADGGRGAPMRCRVALPLAGGNVLEVLTSPPDGDLQLVGPTAIRALRAAEAFTQGP